MARGLGQHPITFRLDFVAIYFENSKTPLKSYHITVTCQNIETLVDKFRVNVR